MYNYINYQHGYERIDNLDNKMNLSTPEEGYNRGNMFSDLYIPYKNYKPSELKPTNEQSALYLEMSKYAFSMHDINLYLDVHPEDMSMLSLFNDYKEKTNSLMKEYENKYGPLTINSLDMSNSFNWVAGDWPWAGGDR